MLIVVGQAVSHRSAVDRLTPGGELEHQIQIVLRVEDVLKIHNVGVPNHTHDLDLVLDVPFDAIPHLGAARARQRCGGARTGPRDSDQAALQSSAQGASDGGRGRLCHVVDRYFLDGVLGPFGILHIGC